VNLKKHFCFAKSASLVLHRNIGKPSASLVLHRNIGKPSASLVLWILCPCQAGDSSLALRMTAFYFGVFHVCLVISHSLKSKFSQIPFSVFRFPFSE